jgi:shikimate dehydrogenase
MSERLRFALLGRPSAQGVLSVCIRAALRDLGLGHTYEPVEVPDLVRLEAMVDAVRQGVFAGANVTAPYKGNVLEMVDRVDASAEPAQAANVLVRDGQQVVAFSTEISALAEDLEALGADARTAAIIGSGGAAVAAAAACVRIGAKIVAVTSRSWPSSDALVSSEAAERLREIGALPCSWPSTDAGAASTSKMSEALRLQWPDLAACSTLLVHATTAGMKGAEPGESVVGIVPWKRLNKGALIYDLVYTASPTPFLQAARERGLRAAGGLGMMVRQGAHALSLWLKVNPNIDSMRLAAQQAMVVKTG